MDYEACQDKIIEEMLLRDGDVSRNEMYKYGIGRLSSNIQRLRYKYVIDTLQYKSKNIAGMRTWGSCIYIIKRSWDNTFINKKYDKQLKSYRENNKLEKDKFFTNDI